MSHWKTSTNWGDFISNIFFCFGDVQSQAPKVNVLSPNFYGWGAPPGSIRAPELPGLDAEVPEGVLLRADQGRDTPLAGPVPAVFQDLMVISWWLNGDLMVISWWFNGDLRVISWWFDGHLMVIWCWFHGDLMVI